MSDDDGHPLAKLVGWIIAFVLFHVIGFAFSEDSRQAQRAAERLGYRDVGIGDSKMFADWRGCGFRDYAGYDAAAKLNGEPVELLMCCGVFSGCYARTGDQ